MGLAALLVENFFSTIIYPSHVITGNEEPVGNEAFRVANGRRTATDRWTTSTANAQAWLKVQCDTARAATGIVLDRGHNLGGVAGVKLQTSPDDSVWTDRLTVTIPATSAPGSLDDANGVTSEEGAWLKRFASVSALYWRLLIPAMGAGLKPQVVGLWLGTWYQPAEGYLTLPVAPEHDELMAEESVSDAGWRGRSTLAVVRSGTLRIQLPSLAEEDTARVHLQQRFGRGRAMWIVHDDAKAERALLAIRPPGGMGFTREPGWFYPQISVSYVEAQPLPR